MTVCATCTPPVDGEHRLSEQHVGVRFGDYGPHWSVLLDDADVTNDCVEAMAGEDGWVILWLNERCGNSDHLRAEQRHGHVSIRCIGKHVPA